MMRWKIPKLKSEYSFDSTKLISREGNNGNLYYVNTNSDLCVKILKEQREKFDTSLVGSDILLENEESLKDMYREFVFMRYVFKNKAKVPEPFGVFYLENEERCKYPGFVMEYIKRYKSLDNFGLTTESVEVKDLIREQQDLIESLGFESRNLSYKKNILWSPEDKDIKIVDAGYWLYYGMHVDEIWEDAFKQLSQ